MSPYGASAKSKKRKLMRNEVSLAPVSPTSSAVDLHMLAESGSAASTPSKQQRRMSVAELEEKKTLLPYLEKIEYVNAQLRARGIDVTPFTKPRHDIGNNDKSPRDMNQESEPLVVESLSSRSEKDDSCVVAAALPSTAAAPLELTAAVLHHRYPRFSASIASTRLRQRPIAWLLKLVEEVYDSYYAGYVECQQASSFALFVRTHMQQTLGLPSLADQESLDLLYNVELHRDRFPTLVLFASFLREIEDEEGALFYVHCRHALQTTFGLSLKTKEKLLQQDFARKFHASGAVVVSNHPLLHDGTQALHFSEAACGLVVQRAGAPVHLTKTLADHVVTHCMTFKRAATVAPNGREIDQSILDLDTFLARLLQLFRAVPEEIVLKYKYNDDGESLTLLTRLQDTIHHDQEMVTLRAALDEHVRAARSLQIECMKVERAQVQDPSRPDLRTKMFLLKNQLRSEERDVESLQEQLHHAEGQINSVWSSVLHDAAKAPTTTLTPLENILARFSDYVGQLHRNALLEKKVKLVLERKLAQRMKKGKEVSMWADQLEALQERCVIKIQRMFRQRRAWARERQAAQAELEAKKQQKQKRKAEKELERKRLEALRERDAQRHLNRMQEKKRRDSDVRKQLKEQEDSVLKKAAMAESERRQDILHLVVSFSWRIFDRWKRYHAICKRIEFGRRMTLLGLFRQWKDYITMNLTQIHAATAIQAGFRGLKGRREARGLRRQRDKKNQLATRNLGRLFHRLLFKVWLAWTAVVAQQQQIKRRFAACLMRLQEETFHQWARLLPRRRAAALSIQSQWRGHKARTRVQNLRGQHKAAVQIQRMGRGFLGRKFVAMRRKIHASQTQGTNSLLRRMMLRTASRCFDALAAHSSLNKHIRGMANARVKRRQRWCFYRLQRYRLRRQRKKAERYRRQFDAATVIQRYFRGYWCRTSFSRLVRRHRSAIKIQRVYRRYRQKWIVYELQRRDYAATRIQCLFRRRKAVAIVNARRNEHLWQATRRGDYHVVLRAFNNGSAWHVDEECNSVLHLACLAGSKRLIKLCLRYGMDINALNTLGLSPLHTMIATTYPQRAELVDYMIDHGAWHECRDAVGHTPLLQAAALGHADCVQVLLARAADRMALTPSNQDAIALATSLNHPTVVGALLEAGFDPNTTDMEDGATLLHECAAQGYLDIARLLLDYNVDMNRQDNEGNTPVIYAVYNNHLDVLELILSRGALPDIVNSASRSAMHWALGKPGAIRLLADYNGDVNLMTREGETPLHLSCASDNYLESTKVLLSYGGSVDSKNSRGNQPAHVAARAGAAATMDLLIEYASNMNYRNFDNKNPLGEARMFNQKAVVAVIQRHYANDMKMLEEAEEILRDEDGVVMPDKTPEEWQVTFDKSVHLGKLSEWTQCVDPDTEWLFYHDGASNTCSWKAPIEFQAALGHHWRVQQQKQEGTEEPVADNRHNDEMKPVDEPLATTDGGASLESKGDGVGVLENPRAIPTVYVYVNDQTSEIRASVPPVDPVQLQALIQGVDQYKMLRSKIHKVSSETAATLAKYKAFWTDFDKDAKTMRAEYQAAVKIQKQYRRHFYQARFNELKLQHKTAIHLQRAYRGRLARRAAAHERRRHRCVTKINALVRGFLARRREGNGNHAWRVQYRAERRATINIQRCWRGMHGRFRAKKMQAMKRGPQTYFEWTDARKHATILQTFQVWQEMQMANTTGYGIFYCNHITGQCVWDKPVAWVEYDRVKFLERQQMHYFGYTTKMLNAAVLLQSLYRMRTARVYFHRLMRGVSICRTCETEYLNDPRNITKLGNYTLFLHAVRHDYDRARPLYQRLMDYMTSRGPDVPFILRCYAVFLYVTEEEDIESIAMLFDRADAIDKSKKTFQLAYLGFFRYSQILFPTNALTNLNYAACLQWVYNQPSHAMEHYLKALEADPYNQRILNLFNVFLERINDPEGDASQHFMRYQARMVQDEDAVRKQEILEAASLAERDRAAILIQTRFRSRKERKRVMRLRSIAPVPHKANSAQELQLHLAFDSIASKNKNQAIIRSDQLVDVYPLVGWSIQDAVDDLAYATTHTEFQYPQSITWTRFHKWVQEAAPVGQWEACFTDENVAYYYNVVSGATQWEKPRVQRAVAPPLEDRWEEAYTDQGDKYYYNGRTGESRWDDPSHAPQSDGWEEAVDDEGRTYYYNSATGESSWTRPSDENATGANPAVEQWEEAEAEDGTVYFVNTVSGDSVWTRPDDAWAAAMDDQGSVYYYHSTSGESQWTSPWTSSPELEPDDEVEG
ncbi:Aste57867_19465 [Aphanomyces stellatus]|uniref:Aste57867_19465 protein n=1 Tax=Aphanomyces stellatus TaxID=120398 RepID=A0A485LEK7_9STRA|nr:hypothetical protein As57867_019401 [Aphanomyces stellatus]VFT96177.1 Aste57867_19465 [Aphanomyces stellatus]